MIERVIAISKIKKVIFRFLNIRSLDVNKLREEGCILNNSEKENCDDIKKKEDNRV